MTGKRDLMGTAGLKMPLMTTDGKPLTLDKVNITIKSMPLIDYPDLPDDLEARLFNVPDQEPRIILIHPASELFVEVSLLDRANMPKYIEALTEARLKQAMGEPPDDGEGYLININEGTEP